MLSQLDASRPVHNYRTRHNANNNSNIPPFTKSRCQQSFIYKSVKIWNTIPRYLWEVPNFDKFKTSYKRRLCLLFRSMLHSNSEIQFRLLLIGWYRVVHHSPERNRLSFGSKSDAECLYIQILNNLRKSLKFQSCTRYIYVYIYISEFCLER